VPWNDFEAAIAEVVTAKQADIDRLDDELTAVRERLGEVTRKLASARSQLSRAKKRQQATV
jgi:uncharacterized coiled-coil protein SlyX